MIGPTLILTAAHCLDDFDAELPIDTTVDLSIRYFEPGLAPDAPRFLYEGQVHLLGDPDFDLDEWGHPLSEFDLGLIELTAQSAWPGTTWEDYLRIYLGSSAGLPVEVVSFGAGRHNDDDPEESYSPVLRNHTFNVGSPSGSTNYFVIDMEEDYGLCSGDSGGPALHSSVSPELVLGVNSRVSQTDPYCALGSSETATISATHWGNIKPLIENGTSASCFLKDDGPIDYLRCFNIPFVNDVDGEGLDRPIATAVLTVIL